MFLSDVLRGASLLSVAAAAGAINANDVLQQNVVARAASVVCSDYAVISGTGATPFPQTQYTTNTWGTGTSGNRRAVQVDSGNVYITGVDATGHPTAWKYGPLGALLGTLRLSANIITGGGAPNSALARLSSGDYVATWVEVGGQPAFAIFDTDLTAVKYGPTIIANTPSSQVSCCPLSGGGFVITWTNSGTSSLFSIYSNAGVLAAGPTVAGGSGNATATPRQLTSGNIAIAVADVGLAQLGYSVISPAGGVVHAYAAIAASSGGSTQDYPEVSVLPSGYFAITTGRNSNSTQQLAVLSDAGVLQGITFAPGNGVYGNTLTNDGTSFWLGSYLGSGDLQITRVGITGGASAVTTAGLATILGASPLAGLRYDPAFGVLIAINGVNRAACYAISASGKVTILTATYVNLGAGHTDCFNEILSDGVVLVGAGGYVQATKVLATSILGVAAQTLAAGNAGTPVLFNMGPGGFQTSPFRGSPGIAFDHSAANPIGNKGTFVTGRSISLKGI